MERGTAEKIVETVGKIDRILSGLDAISNEIDDVTERKKVRRATAMIVIDLHERLTLEAVRDFPDLHPDAEQRE
jgi:hypothetical protein